MGAVNKFSHSLPVSSSSFQPPIARHQNAQCVSHLARQHQPALLMPRPSTLASIFPLALAAPSTSYWARTKTPNAGQPRRNCKEWHPDAGTARALHKVGRQFAISRACPHSIFVEWLVAYLRLVFVSPTSFGSKKFFWVLTCCDAISSFKQAAQEDGDIKVLVHAKKPFKVAHVSAACASTYGLSPDHLANCTLSVRQGDGSPQATVT